MSADNAPINRIYNKVVYSHFRSRHARTSNIPVLLKSGKAAVVSLSLHIKDGVQYGYSHKRWFRKVLGIWTQTGAPMT